MKIAYKYDDNFVVCDVERCLVDAKNRRVNVTKFGGEEFTLYMSKGVNPDNVAAHLISGITAQTMFDLSIRDPNAAEEFVPNSLDGSILL